MQTDSVGNGEPLKVSEQGRDIGSTSHLRTSCLAEGLKGLVVWVATKFAVEHRW